MAAGLLPLPAADPGSGSGVRLEFRLSARASGLVGSGFGLMVWPRGSGGPGRPFEWLAWYLWPTTAPRTFMSSLDRPDMSRTGTGPTRARGPVDPEGW